MQENQQPQSLEKPHNIPYSTPSLRSNPEPMSTHLHIDRNSKSALIDLAAIKQTFDKLSVAVQKIEGLEPKTDPEILVDPDRTYRLLMHDLAAMTDIVDFTHPRKFTSHRRWLGPIITRAKYAISKLIRPVLRVVMFNQIRFNYYQAMMAHRVVVLEKRVLELEQQLKTQKLN